MVIISLIITMLYLLLIGSFIYGFDKVKTFKLENISVKTRFSVIIPFRNEAQNLPTLLTSILKLNYPKDLYEVILVDDASDDESTNLIKGFLSNDSDHIQVIQNIRTSNSPKKDAITTAIGKSKYEWIITTDADCTLPNYWLDSFNAYIQSHNVKCLAAPVTYALENNFLSRFQLLHILSLQGSTIGTFGINRPFLCNGANFAYEKKLFQDLQGFTGNDTIASGDDIFLLEKIHKNYPNHIYYLKCIEAIIYTKPQLSWDALISQHIRWAAKTAHYDNYFGKVAGMIVLLMNALLISLFIMSVFGVFNFKICLYLMVIKFYIDFLLIYKTASFFNQKHILKHYIFGFLAYPLFSSYVAFLSIFKGYNWKGRTFKK